MIFTPLTRIVKRKRGFYIRDAGCEYDGLLIRLPVRFWGPFRNIEQAEILNNDIAAAYLSNMRSLVAYHAIEHGLVTDD